MSERKPPDGDRHDCLDLAHQHLIAGETVALATVIETWGSAPVPVGGRMAIFADGSFEGAISGGCIEGDVIMEAAEFAPGTDPRVLAYGVDGERARAAGLPCGGRIRVLLEALTAADTGYLAARVSAQRERRPLVVATRLADGMRALYGADEDMPAAIAAQAAREQGGVITDALGETFIDVQMPAPRIVIVGATQVAQSLVALARAMGHQTIVVDPRTAFATVSRFPDTRLSLQWPQDALPAIGLDKRTAVAVLAHTDHIDDAALITALQSAAGYVGALGSRRNHARRVARLRQAGVSEALIGRIRAPIGLDIGARTPAEIALAVMAEIVAVLAGRGDRR